MRRKLTAMDLDGTAVDSGGRIPRNVKDAICAAREAGHVAAFVSGRADPDMVPIEEDCRIVGYPVLNNGGKIVRSRDHLVLHDDLLNREGAARLVDFCLEQGFLLYVMDGRDWYGNRWNGRLQSYMVQLPLDHIEGLAVMGDASRVERFIGRGWLGLRAMASEAGRADILNQGTDKWQGILKLLELLGMEPEDVIAAGDHENGLEMVSQAGMGMAMGNALESVKARADYVTVRDNGHGAAADMINQLVWGGQEACA